MCISAPVDTTNKLDDSSAENSSEEFEKLKKDFEKLLTEQQKTEFHTIVNNVNAAKTPEEALDGVVSVNFMQNSVIFCLKT